MSEPRQKTVAMTPAEKRGLDKAKAAYENKTGDTGDWGKFLGTVSILGLAALGIYKLVNSSKNDPTATCVECGDTFAIAHSGELPPVVYVTCPKCKTELVVRFDAP